VSNGAPAASTQVVDVLTTSKVPARIASAFILVAALAAGASAPAAAVGAELKQAEADGAITSMTETEPPTETEAALLLAASSGESVVVESETTPISLVTAEPDGTMTLVSSTLPVRAQLDEQWVPLDLNLSINNGRISPAVTAVPVEFSAGGSGPMARIQAESGEWVAEEWPYGDLPRPEIDGDVAIYRSVLPDIDLRLTATATGMSEVLVVKNARAAQNPKLMSIRLEIDGAQLSEDRHGATTAATASESEIVAATPTWWDSSNSAAGPDSAGADGETQAVDQTVESSSVTLNLETAVDQDGLVYPLYIDPDWSTGHQAFWFTDRRFPTTSYLNGANAAGYQSLGSGKDSGGTYLSRAFWQFGTTPLIGKQILNAVFSATQTYSNVCNDANPVQMYRYGPAGAGFTWNSDPGAWAQLLDQRTLPYGSSCLGASVFGMNATAGVASVASTAGSIIQLGLRTTNEASVLTRKHFAYGASLTVTYNSIPYTPTGPVFTSPSRPCGTYAAPAYVNGTSPITMRVSASDPDSVNIMTAFYVVDGDNVNINKLPSNIAPNGYMETPYQAAGLHSKTMPANVLAPGFYAWRAASADGYSFSASTGWCWFVVKNSPPAAPQVSSRAAGPYIVGVATSVTIASAPADKVSAIAYWWSYSSVTTPAPPAPVTFGGPPQCGTAYFATGRFACTSTPGAPITVTVAPVASPSVLWVAAYDLAGNVSASTPVAYTGVDAAVADTANVDFNSGHGWPTRDSTSPLGPQITDLATGNGALTSPRNLTLTSVVTRASVGEILAGDGLTPVIDFAGYVPLNRYLSGNIHLELPTSTPPTGSVMQEQVGWMMPPTSPGSPQAPGTVALYRCVHNTNEDFITIDPDCEGGGSSAVNIGSAWQAGSAPADISPVTVFSCVAGDRTVTRTSGTSANCVLGEPLGILAASDPSLTADPLSLSTRAVDMSGSITVSAWLKPDSTAMASAAIAQPGLSGFALAKSGNRWAFCAGSMLFPTCAFGAVATSGVWQFVTGVWDKSNGEIRLFVGDTATPDAVTQLTSTPASSSNDITIIGAQNLSGANRWRGQMAYPTIFPGVANKAQRQNLFYQDPPN
jgi:hypothetical protein